MKKVIFTVATALVLVNGICLGETPAPKAKIGAKAPMFTGAWWKPRRPDASRASRS